MRGRSFTLVPDPLGAPLDERLCRRAYLGGAGTGPRLGSFRRPGHTLCGAPASLIAQISCLDYRESLPVRPCGARVWITFYGLTFRRTAGPHLVAQFPVDLLPCLAEPSHVMAFSNSVPGLRCLKCGVSGHAFRRSKCLEPYAECASLAEVLWGVTDWGRDESFQACRYASGVAGSVCRHRGGVS